ncbi:acetyl-CoA carboxylase [Lacticaseibacillus paracasei]|nr:acetyl-CoA carboxylase [Lacticaseibacillus paracasei]
MQFSLTATSCPLIFSICLQSVPLHKLAHYDLADLEKLLKALRQDIKLTIEFVGFTGERWPASQRLIQRKRVPLE